MASSRVYIGKLPQDVRRSDIDELFKGYGVRDTTTLPSASRDCVADRLSSASHFLFLATAQRVLDVKLMGAYGFCEFEDPRDAEDVVKVRLPS